MITKNCRPSEMIILAGGFGTRLKSVVSDVPKPMASVAGRPFLEYLMDYWIRQEIQSFIISTGYLADVIRSHFGTEYCGATITYVHEDSPLGTGGALRLALNSLTWTNKVVLMANGDTWFPIQLDRLCADAQVQGTPITLSIKKLEKNDRYGGVQLDQSGKVATFGNMIDGPCYINAGACLLDIAVLKRELLGQPESFSLENDFLPQFAKNGMVGASIQEKPFLDIGIPEDYQRAPEFFEIKKSI
jgi:D-glycero-alpha-D-manno-heptose 1-phosphate guanylyltransferase